MSELYINTVLKCDVDWLFLSTGNYRAVDAVTEILRQGEKLEPLFVLPIGRVYRRAVKELMEKGLVRKGDHGLEIIDEGQLRRFLESSEWEASQRVSSQTALYYPPAVYIAADSSLISIYMNISHVQHEVKPFLLFSIHQYKNS
ncbi:hypothetical protein BOO29_11250 [Vibrio navarrensis]|nr:hypothetical protein [Vibrio navarrensis]